ncbi:tRNA (guanosine(37)-N1)-methyltransferase TrmD [Exilibacterium tricleocarpae]|uniref:tRNA (guanine-N(1)-)-methyltransferase n=1 Tax=Exilibacterium tricleocarpae TaxID=2591008 RepID=A0A545TNE3_9GAMM|nr:tRNA (guanosine(37)-N1)-methyltransferase TrmD [Exilibacterium tricleocarpae]TQV78681.1 tRNA (guanosine(37)-N1)-methyltransferase TrmD [Exilibacterium tricleocarpae]
MRIAVVTLFPEMFSAVTDFGVSGRALQQGLVELAYWNPRQFASDRHQTVDDRPYGGGPGMVMLADPLRQAIAAAKQWATAEGEMPAQVIYLSPQGHPLGQSAVVELAAPLAATRPERRGLVLLAGRYEGVDERLLETEVDAEWSIGDYVLSGGELAAMVVIDAVIRLLPGALGHADSAAQDSFSDGLLDCPHYTRPECYRGRSVPPVLLSGDHGRIRRWRRQQALGRTWLRRPDLLEKLTLDEEQQELLAEFKGNLN